MNKIVVHLRDLNKPLRLATDMRHTIEIAQSRARVLRLGDVHFHHDSAVMLPWASVAEVSSEVPVVTAMDVLAHCYRQASEHPRDRLLIAGHADSVGDAEYNLKLSQLRADNVLAALLGEKEDWATIAHYRHQTEDYQVILKWVYETFGWDTDPGPVDNVRGPSTRRAVTAFQAHYREERDSQMATDGVVGPKTWAAFFDLYMQSLGELMQVDEQGLAALRGQLRFLDGSRRAVGCGQCHPLQEGAGGRSPTREAPASSDLPSNAKNRRTEILFFEPGQEPSLACHPGSLQCTAGACEIYGPIYHLDPLTTEGSPRALCVVIDDAWFGPVGGTEVDISFEGGETARARSDETGCITLASRASRATLTIHRSDAAAVATVFLRPPSARTKAGTWQRLANLGYARRHNGRASPPDAAALQRAIQEFQADRAMPVTGDFDAAIAEAIRAAHDDDDRPWNQRERVPPPTPHPSDPRPKEETV